MKLHEVLDDEVPTPVDHATFAKHAAEMREDLVKKQVIIKKRLDYFSTLGNDLQRRISDTRTPLFVKAKELGLEGNQAIEYVNQRSFIIDLPPTISTFHPVFDRSSAQPNRQVRASGDEGYDLDDEAQALMKRYDVARKAYNEVGAEIQRLGSFAFMFKEALNIFPTRATRQDSQAMQRNIKLEPAGPKGAYSTAFKMPGDVEKVLKVGRTDYGPQHDGYLAWLRAVHDHPGNPFLPQIDKLKMFKDPLRSDAAHYHAKQENLVPATQLHDEEARRLIEHYLNQKIAPEMEQKFQADAKKWGNPLAFEYVGHFAGALRNILRGNTPHGVHIKDKNLLQALSLLQQVHNAGYQLDLHGGNIMFRRTPYGIQPVFTDPFTTHGTDVGTWN